MNPMPDWKLLTAFEAVARHGNFSRAAEELDVLQPAISRRVAELERELRVPLIRRTRPRASLTPEGQILFGAVSAGLAQVGSAIERIAQHPAPRPLVINTTIGFASCFLLRRLSRFNERHPQILLELVSRDLNDGYREDDADVITVFDSKDHLPGVEQHRIFREEMIAVCSPAYRDAHPVVDDDFSGHRLLHLTGGIHGDDWKRFVLDTGIAIETPAPANRFTSFMVYLHAALNGNGIAIGWSHLLQDYLDSGQLVLATPRRIRTHRGYHCCITSRGSRRKATRLFASWLTSLHPADCGE